MNSELKGLIEFSSQPIVSYPVQFVVESAGVADGLPLTAASPEGSSRCMTIRAQQAHATSGRLQQRHHHHHRYHQHHHYHTLTIVASTAPLS